MARSTKHPLCIRWNHWLNFPLLFVMIWSGFLIYWAFPAYFVPRSWLAALGMNSRLAEGISWHFVFAWLYTINGLIYVLYLAISGQYKNLFPTRADIKRIPAVMMHDLGFRKEAPPQGKYNAAQKLAYTAILFMGIGSVLTGVAIYKPVQFNFLVTLLGGYQAARLEHFIFTWAFMLFFLGHVTQVIRAGWSNFRVMVTETDPVARPQRARLGIALWALGMILIAASLWAVKNASPERGIAWPLRKGLNLQGSFWDQVLAGKAKAPSPSEPPRGKLRVNGKVGMLQSIDIAQWRLTVTDPETQTPVQLSIDDIKKLPVTTTSFEFKCIEGWSQLMECTGVKFSDLMASANVGRQGNGTYPYVGISTVNNGYFVSLESKAFMHPQTVLCYEMNGEPITMDHGYPLRLATPVKYGVKSIKQIGSIQFSDARPADYWAGKGYDDYLGL